MNAPISFLSLLLDYLIISDVPGAHLWCSCKGLSSWRSCQWTGRQTVAISIAQHHRQFVSTAQTPPAPQGPSSACFTPPLQHLWHFILSLGLPPCILSQEIKTWQGHSLHSITLTQFEAVLGGLILPLNSNKAGCCQNVTVTMNQFFTRSPWKIWYSNASYGH